MRTQPVSAKDYHQRTKHRLDAYARGPEGLDWDNQPDPFRRFAGSSQIPLPLQASGLSVSYADLFKPGAITPRPLNRGSLAMLCELAMGLSAWKVYGDSRWSLRCNPSSGNLHPTEAYFLLSSLEEEIAAGVYHYQSHDHVLEQRCTSPALAGQLPEHGFLLGLSSIHWREAWKYGERAYRYCQLDIGHMMAAVRYAAACLGWRVTLLGEWDDESIAKAIGINRESDFANAENESPDVMLLMETAALEKPGEKAAKLNLGAIVDACVEGHWQGQANCLSEEHEYKWPILDKVTTSCLKGADQGIAATAAHVPEPNPEPHPILQPDYLTRHKASEIIRQRRSAQAFDGTSILPFAAFCRLLDAALPHQGTPPFDLNSGLNPQVHLVLFIHRVEGLNPGLYCLPRSLAGEELLRESMSPQFQWQRQGNMPEHLPLYLLVQAKCGNAAHTLSCHQPIAADSAFALAMIAEFDEPLEKGDWMYRQLFWEAGLIGQSLYLEAEASGMRGTGIGCYFDDKVHEILGIQDTRLQDLYHFTVGAPQIDARLATLPPYSHLQRA